MCETKSIFYSLFLLLQWHINPTVKKTSAKNNSVKQIIRCIFCSRVTPICQENKFALRIFISPISFWISRFFTFIKSGGKYKNAFDKSKMTLVFKNLFIFKNRTLIMIFNAKYTHNRIGRAVNNHLNNLS